MNFLEVNKTVLRSFLVGCIVYAGLIATPQAQSQGVPAGLKAAIERNTQGTVKVDRVSVTPMPGVFQVLSGTEVFYSDTSGRYAFVGGAMIDIANKIDLTAPVLENVNSIPWDSLPLKHAIKEVYGNGKKKMAVFEDPLCPICRSFNKFVDQLEDVTVYRFVFPVIDPKSAQIARTAWCSSERNDAWRSVMQGRRVEGTENCDVSGIVATLKFGEQHHINSTPTVVLPNGKRLVGATPPEQFIAELDASQR